MTTKTKVILLIAGTAIAGTGFWLWWRQKDAVPASAVPIMAQAKAVLAGSQAAAAGTSSPVTPQSFFPTDIPLPVIATT